MTSFLLVKHSVADKRGNLRDRLWRCAASGILDKSTASVLDHAAELLRTVEHVTRLVAGRSSKWLPATEHGRKVAERLTGQILECEFPEGLESELDRTLGNVRAIYERVLGDVSVAGVAAPDHTGHTGLTSTTPVSFCAGCRQGPGRDGGSAGSAILPTR
jgi:glutamine synthetase adenylyltransferase